MKILIAGAGVGGLSLAGFLRGQGHEVTLVERSEPNASAGFSIGLWDNGRRMLERLGLAERFDRVSTRVRRYRIFGASGARLRDYDLRDFYVSYGVAYSHIDRADLLSMLRDAAGVAPRYGLEVTGVRDSGEGAEVSFADGSAERFDLVVGADGISSRVRASAGFSFSERYDDWRVWYSWVNSDFTEDATVSEYVGAGEFAGLFDVGPRTLMVLIAPARHGERDDLASRKDRLLKTFAGRPDIVAALRAKEPEDFVPTDLRSVRVDRWSIGRVALLGDAAHGFEPHAGLGASMAMEDAYVLAAKLLQVGPDFSLPEALAAYSRARAPRVRLARRLTARMKAWSFVKSKIARRIIDLALPFVPLWFFVRDYRRLMDERI